MSDTRTTNLIIPPDAGTRVPIKVFSRCGLCNRLRVIFHFYQQLRDDQDLMVNWKWDRTGTTGEFYDCFERIPRLEFTPNRLTNPIYIGNGSQLTESVDYSLLRLRKYLRDLVAGVQESLGPDYIAVHVRRTDVSALYKQRGLELDRDDFTQEHAFIDAHPGKPLFVAADSKEAYQQVVAPYLGKRKINKPNFLNTSQRRKTTLQQAVVDLWTCIESSEFYGFAPGGVPISSFTKFILDCRATNVSDI